MNNLPSHFFVASDGALHDTRQADWHLKPVRETYRHHCTAIATSADFKATLRAGAYAWPGMYPLYFVTDDGAALSFESARNNARYIIDAINSKHYGGGWRVCAVEVNYEDSDLVCDHSGQSIPSAYGED